MGTQRKHLVTATAVAIFCATKVAFSEPSHQPATPVRDLKISDIFVPQELGYVIDRHELAGTALAPIVIHIQEAHTNYEGQQHLVGILEQLVRSYGLKLILVEGGSGDASLAYLRRYTTPERRRQVAERHLKAGLLSAEEYLDLVSDTPLTIWGVEDQALYEQNLQAFLESEQLSNSLRPTLAAVRAAAERLQPFLFNTPLNELDTLTRALQQHRLGLGDASPLIKQLAGQYGIALDAYPNLTRFLAVRELEGQIQPTHAQREQRTLLSALSRALPPEQVEQLLGQASAMSAGTLQRHEFYESLKAYAAQASIDWTAYPELARYVQYLQTSVLVDTTRLADEVDLILAAMRGRLATTPESRQLDALLTTLGMIEKLIALDLSPEEYQRLMSQPVHQASSQWTTFLAEQCERRGWPRPSLEGLSDLERTLPVLQRFYEAAQQRDEALVSNALAKLQQSGEHLAVLITGGFHAPRLSAMLKSRGVSTVAVVPKVSRQTDERLYRAVVRFKSGHGSSLEEIMDLAR